MFDTQKPDRGGFHSLRSTLMFASKPRPKLSRSRLGPEGPPDPVGAMSTEGRVWEFMYGAGPSVIGVTGNVTEKERQMQAEAITKRNRVRGLFEAAVDGQRCHFCGGRISVEGRGGRQGVCESGHFFATCGASGLAIQEPGISRACGVCGARTLRVAELTKAVPGLEEVVEKEVSGEVCGGCGGKFLD
jgi:hypothetical protein